MPAITLGLAEVEERLRALRRRLNSVTAQHSTYVGTSVVLLVSTAIIVAGLRASATVFLVTVWAGGALAVMGLAACVTYARRRWLDVRRTAYLADARGQLTDRLSTLVDLRLHPRPARLAPVLVAQALALGPQWQTARLAPRRIPRSIFATLAAFLLLAATAFIERHTPAPTAGASTPAGKFTASNSAAGQKMQATAPGEGTNETGTQSAATLPAAAEAGGAGGAQAGNGQSSDASMPGGEGTTGGSLSSRLQRTIQRAFHGESSEQSRQASQLASGAGAGSKRDGTNPDEGKHNQHGTQSNPSTSDQASGAGQPQRSGGAKSEARSASNQGSPNAPQDSQGASPGAGEGSSPAGLMDPNAVGAVIAGGEAKRFKLTITSFLHPVQQSPQGRSPRSGSRGNAGAAVTDGGDGLPLNERQMADDALRKAEIPPEYEELVRRVYSSRAEP